MKRFIICNLLLVICHLTFAQGEFDVANAAYADGRYEEAAAGYEALLAEGPNATLYYNLGNARFKQGELAQAILNYERALKRAGYVWKEAHVDAMQSAIELMRAISGHKKIEEIPSFLHGQGRCVTVCANKRGWCSLSVCLSWV